MLRVIRTGALTLLALAWTELASAWYGPVARRPLAQTNCARCYAVGKVGPSHAQEAPPFRQLHTRYPAEDLAEAPVESIQASPSSSPRLIRSALSLPTSSRWSAEASSQLAARSSSLGTSSRRAPPGTSRIAWARSRRVSMRLTVSMVRPR